MFYKNDEVLWMQRAVRQLQELACFIRPGMTRKQVELVLVRSKGGIQGEPVTIYYEIPGAKIEVVFNCLGFPPSPDDQVVAQPRVSAMQIGVHPWQKWLEK